MQGAEGLWKWAREWLAASPDSGFRFGFFPAQRSVCSFCFRFRPSVWSGLYFSPSLCLLASKMFSHQLGPEKAFSGHLALAFVIYTMLFGMLCIKSAIHLMFGFSICLLFVLIKIATLINRHSPYRKLTKCNSQADGSL